MNAASTLMIDLVPDQGSSVTACVCELKPYETRRSADFLHFHFHFSEQFFTLYYKCGNGIRPRSDY